MYSQKPEPFRFNRFILKSPKGKYSPDSEESCSTGISGKLDTDRDTENVGSSPGDNGCSTGISSNPVSTQLSLVGNEQFFWFVGDRICHRKDPNRTGTVIKSVKGSTRYHVRWDVGGKSAVEGRNLSLIPVEQRDYRKLLTVDPDYLLEKDGQFTIFSDDEPPDPDDFESNIKSGCIINVSKKEAIATDTDAKKNYNSASCKCQATLLQISGSQRDGSPKSVSDSMVAG